MTRLLRLAVLLLTWLCISGCEGRVKHVVVVWRTGEDDVIYQDFHQKIKKEFHSRGYRVKLTDCNLNDRDYSGLKLTDRVSAALDKAEEGGHNVDLLLAHGDYSNHLVKLSKDPRMEDIPMVSFAVFCDEINGNVQKRKSVLIRDSITVKENLDFLKFVFGDRYRVISLLDWRSSWIDKQIMNNMAGQMAALDTSGYYCGLGLKCSVSDLESQAKAGKTVFYALSLENTSSNKNPLTGELFPATWAFFSQKSDNHVLMVKHDKISERLELNPDFPLYCTAVAEGFGFYDNCIGGHFAPFEVQIKEAVDKALLLWDGVDAESIPVTWHKRDYYVNWVALRSQMSLGRMPDYVHLEGVNYLDRHPKLDQLVRKYGWLSLSALFLIVFALIMETAIHNAFVRRELIRISRESIEKKNDLNMLLKGTNSVSWTIEGDRIVYANEGEGFKNNMTLSERHAQSNPFYEEKLKKFFETDIPGSYTLQIERNDFDGKSRWYELRMTVVETLEGIRKSGITINIDQEKKFEASLHEAHRKLALANERENFISAMSHEMRTPLNSIVGFSQIMTTPGFNCTEEELKEYGSAIEESNYELMKIIEDMLALTHMDNSNIRMDLQEYRVSDIFKRFESGRVGHDHAPDRTVRYVSGPEDARIRVDINLLENVWKNLVGNALKFSHGSTAVSLGWIESPSSVRLYVSDEGIGIDKSQREIIFNRFYQVDHFTQGTGLGLALAKEYITRMGGTIVVDSELGTGSTFYLKFPKESGGQKS